MGAVVDWVRRLVPGSYSALVGASGTTFYSLDDVQAQADYVKYRLFATIVDPALEATLYTPELAEFLGKITTLQFIPPAVDFWGTRLVSETTTGTSESVTYPDRRADLWKIFDKIQAAVTAEWDMMAAKYGFKLQNQANRPKVSYYDNGRGVLISHDVYTDLGLKRGPFIPSWAFWDPSPAE
jgi:hypothetical protein